MFQSYIYICDPTSENQPSFHLVIFQETPDRGFTFGDIQLQKLDLSLTLYSTCVLNSTILSYLLAYNVANLLNQLWLNFKIILPFFLMSVKLTGGVGEMTGGRRVG